MNDDKKQKLLIALAACAIIFCIVLLIRANNKSKPEYIVVNDSVLGYVNQKWFDIKNDSPIFDDYRFRLFNKNEDKGKFELRYFHSSWYYFDKDEDSHKFQGSIFAYAGSRDLELEKVEKKEITNDDLNDINSIFMEGTAKIDDVEDLTTHEKIEFDFNNDGSKDVIYSVSNVSSEDDVEKYFSAVLYKSKDKSNVISYNDSTSGVDKYDIYIYSLDYIFKLDNQYNLLIPAAKDLDINSLSNIIYKYNQKDNNFEEVKSLEKNYIKIKHKNRDHYKLTMAIIVVAAALIGLLVYAIIKKKKAEHDEI